MEKMKAQQSTFAAKAATVFWILVNVWSVVGLVFINKSIFSKYANTGVTVTLSHMYSTCIALTGANLAGVVKAKPIPFLKIFPLALLNSSAIVFSNLALHHSPVTVYQIFKVMITPCVAFLQAIFWPASISLSLLLCLIVITVGGLVTVSSPSHIHLSFNSLGVNFSAMFISALFQIITAKKMKDLKTSPNELLFYQAPMNVLIMFVFLLMFEADSFKTVISDYSYLKVVFIGSLLAPIINLSTTQVIHRTSPIMYSVVSQLKSVIIIMFSIIFLHEHPSTRSIVGLCVLVIGVVLYVVKSNNSRPPLNKSTEIIFSPTMTTTTTITIASSPAPSPTLNNTPLALRLSQHMGSEIESQQECQYSIFNWNHVFIFFALSLPALGLSLLPANNVQNSVHV